MFGKITSWMERRRLRGRGLFRFFDGRRYRHVDPLRMWREVEHHSEFNLETMPEAVAVRDEKASEAFYAAMCEVFGIERFDDSTGRGMTDEEIMGLLVDLSEFLGAVKKNIDTGPISPADTD